MFFSFLVSFLEDVVWAECGAVITCRPSALLGIKKRLRAGCGCDGELIRAVLAVTGDRPDGRAAGHAHLLSPFREYDERGA